MQEGASEAMTSISPSLCVSIVNYRTPLHTIDCLKSLLPERGSVPDLRVVIADGASEDDSCATIAAWIVREGHGGWVQLVSLSRNGGFGWAHNQVMQRMLQGEAPPDYFYLLNPDAAVLPGSLRASIAEMEADPSRAVTGGLMYNMDGVLQISAHRFPDWRSELAAGTRVSCIRSLLGNSPIGLLESDTPREVDWVSGSNMMLRTQALRECGLFDTGFFLYFEEIELMWRLKRAGWTIWQTPHSGITHEGGAATKVSRDAAERRRTPLPTYWYRSERRFFTLTQGAALARFGFWSWLLGRMAIGMPRWLISKRVRAHSVYRELHGKWAAWRERGVPAAVPSIAWPDDPLDEPPGWDMQRSG